MKQKTTFFKMLADRKILAVLLALIVAVATTVGALANLPGSSFNAGDGNLIADADDTIDWSNVGISCENPVAGCDIDLPTGRDDNSFGQGAKEDIENPTVVSGSIPNNKSDLLRFYVANTKESGFDFLYLAWERVQEPNGTTNMDFEFNQSSVVGSNGVTSLRTAGDVLIKYDLAKGGTTPALGYHLWVTEASALADPDIPDTAAAACEANNAFPCWSKVNDLAGDFEGSINSGPVDDPILPGPRTLSARTFGEAAINLTTSGIFPADQCVSFGSAYLKSRSSDAFTSELKDFIAPIPVNVSNCGTISIIKQTLPDGAAGDFNYSTTGGLSPVNFTLQDNGQQSYNNVFAGSYTVTEGNTPGFVLESVVCSATPGSSYQVNGATVTIDLVADGDVTCTYTNKAQGKIIVEKQTDPNGSAQSFNFSASYDLDGFSLTDGQQYDSGFLSVGTYSVSETVPAGWDLTSAICSDNSPVSAINLNPGEVVTCVFTNTQRASINILKQDDAGNVLAGAQFTLFYDAAPLGGSRGAEDTSTGQTCTTDAQGKCSMSNIVPGQYWVAETVTPAGYNTAADQNIVLSAGQTLNLTFVNPRLFKVIVLVCQESNGQLYGSLVTLGGVTKATLSAGDSATLCSLGGATFGSLTTGTYTPSVVIGLTPQ